MPLIFTLFLAALLAQGCAHSPTEAQEPPLSKSSYELCDKGAYWCAGGISQVWGRE